MSRPGLAYARQRVQQWMPETATVIRTEMVDDGMGGETEGDPETVGEFPCRLEQSVVPREASEGERPVAVTLWRAYLPWGTDVREEDQLTIAGDTYEVAGTNAGATDAVEMLVQLRKVE